MTNPIVLNVSGDNYPSPCTVGAIIWEGATSSGNTAVLMKRTLEGSYELLWPGRTDTTHTYLGIKFDKPGISCPYGFELVQISAGQICVYLAES